MSRKALDRSILTVETFQTAMDAAKRDVCCQIAEMMEDEANNVVDNVEIHYNQNTNNSMHRTLEEVFETGWVNSLGWVFPDCKKVTLFIKKESKKAVQDWQEKPFHLYAIDLIMPPQEGFSDEVVAKFQLIGKYLDSNGDSTTMNNVHVNCCLIERNKGWFPEFMLQAEYGLYLDRKRAELAA